MKYPVFRTLTKQQVFNLLVCSILEYAELEAPRRKRLAESYLRLNPEHAELIADLEQAHADWARHHDTDRLRKDLCTIARKHFLSQAAVFAGLYA